MNTQAYRPMHLRLLMGGIAGILVSGIAIASLAISARDANTLSTPAEPPEGGAERAMTAPNARALRCKECGVIESARKIEIPDELIHVHAPGRFAARNGGETDGKTGRYAITIRLRDGSMRVITDAYPANWRPGERVSLIGGME